MHKNEKYIIDSKIQFLQNLIEAYQLYAQNGDAKTYCKTHNIRYGMLIDLLNDNWGFVEDRPTNACEWLMEPIESLRLSVRPYNVLKRAKINTVRELLTLNRKELLSLKNMGKTCLQEIEETLHGIGFYHFLKDKNEDG